MKTIPATLKQVFTLRWNPNKDLAVVALSWILVVGALYTATAIVGQAVWGGMAYFFHYAVVGAALCGVGIPLYWMTVVRRRPIADLGIATHWLGRSLVRCNWFSRRSCTSIRWRRFSFRPSNNSCRWLLWRFTNRLLRGDLLARVGSVAFGGSFWYHPHDPVGFGLVCGVHIGYGMPASETITLFFVGVMFAVVFADQKRLHPVAHLPADGAVGHLDPRWVDTAMAAALGFVEVLILMFVFVWWQRGARGNTGASGAVEALQLRALPGARGDDDEAHAAQIPVRRRLLGNPPVSARHIPALRAPRGRLAALPLGLLALARERKYLPLRSGARECAYGRPPRAG